MELEVGQARYTPQRIFCIGRNYVAHAAELGNEVPDSPVVFIKPVSCLVPAGASVPFPGHGDELHHEAELVVLIGRDGRPTTDHEARGFVAGLALGLDLTLRDVQSALKAASLPWEKAKAFDHAAPLGRFVPVDELDLAALSFECRVDGEVRQRGDTSLMVFPVTRLITELAGIWTLRAGDLIYTGTPAGVARLEVGNTIEVEGVGLEPARWTIAARSSG